MFRNLMKTRTKLPRSFAIEHPSYILLRISVPLSPFSKCAINALVTVGCGERSNSGEEGDREAPPLVLRSCSPFGPLETSEFAYLVMH